MTGTRSRGSSIGAAATMFIFAVAACKGRADARPHPGEPPAVAALPPDLSLPLSSATELARPAGRVFVLTPKRLNSYPDGREIAVPPSDAALHGFGSGDKRGSRNDYFLVSLHQDLMARSATDAAAAEVLLAVDPSTPYRPVVEVIYTVDQWGAPLGLLVRSGTREAVIHLPRIFASDSQGPCDAEMKRRTAQLLTALRGEPHDAATDATRLPSALAPSSPAATLPTRGPMCLSVVAVQEGFVVSAFGARIAAGCEAAGPGVAVPKSGEAYDFVRLRACAARLEPRGTELQATVTASSDTSMQTMVGMLDALRGDEASGPLFSVVSFGVPK